MSDRHARKIRQLRLREALLSKFKLLACCIAALALTATATAPVGAWFRSHNQAKTTGLVKYGKTTFDAPNGFTVKCESAAGEWSIQTKGQFKDHQQVNVKNSENSKQVKTTYGPHLYVKITQWNHCEDATLVVLAAWVEPCTIQEEQPQKAGSLIKYSVVTPCVTIVTGDPCGFEIFAGNESTEVNAFLKQVKGENSDQDVLGTANVEGLQGDGGCTGPFTAGKFRSEEGSLNYEGLELA
jgi:hypothetical protein